MVTVGMPPAILELIPEEIEYVTEPGTALDIGNEEQPYDDFFGIAHDEDLSPGSTPRNRSLAKPTVSRAVIPTAEEIEEIERNPVAVCIDEMQVRPDHESN